MSSRPLRHALGRGGRPQRHHTLLRRTALATALLAGAGRAGWAQAAGAAPAAAATPAALPGPAVGQPAPDFTLSGATRYGLLRMPVRLSDYRGQTVVLAFFYKARTKG